MEVKANGRDDGERERERRRICGSGNVELESYKTNNRRHTTRDNGASTSRTVCFGIMD